MNGWPQHQGWDQPLFCAGIKKGKPEVCLFLQFVFNQASLD